MFQNWKAAPALKGLSTNPAIKHLATSLLYMSWKFLHNVISRSIVGHVITHNVDFFMYLSMALEIWDLVKSSLLALSRTWLADVCVRTNALLIDFYKT